MTASEDFEPEEGPPPSSEDTKPPRRLSRRVILAGLATTGLASTAGFLQTDAGDKSLARLKQFGLDLEDALANLTEVPRLSPRILAHVTEYTEFINTLGLRYLSAEEIIRPHRNVRAGVANELPPKHMWNRIAPTLKIADEIRHQLGKSLLCINSAYRSPAYNAVCSGAASRSYHMKNCALDLMFEGGPEAASAVAAKIRDRGSFKGGIGTYATFIHIDTRGHNATWSS